MRLAVHPDAQSDVVEAADWYDQRAVGLGDELMAELDTAFGTLLERPHIWPIWPGTEHIAPPVQRYLLPRFRYYALAYQRYDDQVHVLSLVHLSRRPFYWLKRARA